MLYLFSRLFEEQRSEGVEIESPVSPYVAAVRLIEDVVEALLGESLVESLGSLIEEVGGSASQEVELHASVLESLDLLCGG